MKRARLIMPMLITVGFFMQTCDQATRLEEFVDVEQMVLDAKTRITEITLEEFRTLLDGEEMFTIIDVRTQEEHDAGYIPGSLNIPRGVIEFRIANEKFWEEEGMYVPLKDETLVIYCKSGNRSALTADALRKLGYKKIYSLNGGFLGWKKIYPDEVEKNIVPAHVMPAGPATAEEEGGSC